MPKKNDRLPETEESQGDPKDCTRSRSEMPRHGQGALLHEAEEVAMPPETRDRNATCTPHARDGCVNPCDKEPHTGRKWKASHR